MSHLNTVIVTRARLAEYVMEAFRNFPRPGRRVIASKVWVIRLHSRMLSLTHLK